MELFLKRAFHSGRPERRGRVTRLRSALDSRAVQTARRARLASNLLRCLVLSCLVSIFLGNEADAASNQQRTFTPDEYIEQRCTFCHSRILTFTLLNWSVEKHGIAELDAFLARHHLPDAEAREVIIHYLDRSKD